MDSTTSSQRATPTLLLQQQLSNDGPRTQLRDSLLSYLRVHDDVDDQSPVVSSTPARWKPIIAAPPAPPAHQQQPPLSATSLLVGKPDQLLESLQAFAAHSRRIAQACHASPPNIANITTTNTTPQLDWLRALTRPVTSFRTYTGDERVLDLLRLRHALQHDAANFDDLTAPARRQVAFQLARELPHFDRDLTAYYMQPAPDTPEYELHVAHSLLRLDPSAHPTYQTLLAALPTWRHTGLVHVLAVAALHMPAVADWFPHNPPSPTRDEAASALRECLTGLNANPTRYRTHMQDLVTLLTCDDTATTTTQAVFHTLDTAAVLMRVKSNAPANAPGGHCLDSALATFPIEEECALDAAKLPQLWASIKPALERALPPSLLLPRPAAAAVWSDTLTPTRPHSERARDRLTSDSLLASW